jgi:tight adherence protein C
MVLFLAVTALAVALYLVGEAATYPSHRRRNALRRASTYGRAREGTRPEAERVSFRERVIAPTIQNLAALTLRLNPKTSVESIGARLLSAGLSTRFTVTQFLAAKAGAAIGGAAIGFFFGLASTPVLGVLFAPVLAGVGFLLPDVLLKSATRSRRERIRSELPDVLDVLAVSVEAGLGLDGAITKLAEHMKGALVDEFSLTLGEMRIGEARHDALRKMAERVPAPEVAAFVRAVIQADQLGISLGRILRVQAADSRLRRQLAAEERAMKAPIKMLFPTSLFIFPAMFLVILGPALLNLEHYLK